MDIVYVDNHLLIINKRAGIPTQPSPGAAENATDWGKAWIKRTYDKPGKVFLEPIHRLDKPVSGLVLFARTSKALSRLQELMRERKIGKVYYALTENPLPADSGVLENHLVHDEHRARVVASAHPEGKRAVLTYRTVKQTQMGTLLEIELETGRYHQIRIQLAHAGSPVIGDRKYNSKKNWSKEGIALHHGKLTFQHPVTKEDRTFTAPLPFSP